MSILFISPCKTSAVDLNGKAVQKLRDNMSLPGMMLVGSLEAAGFETHFMDLTTEDQGNQWMVGKNLLAYGLSTDNSVQRIAELKPRFVLITSMFSFEYMLVDELVKAIKNKLPDTYVILGGIHASAKPEWHFEESDPDFIIIGEGERTIVELITELMQPDPDPEKVAGIAFCNEFGGVVKTSKRKLLTELDRPWAVDKVLLHPDGSPRYIEHRCRKSPLYVDNKIGENVISFAFSASRGCPRACHYCASTYRTGKEIRHMGAYNTFLQFMFVRNKFNVSVFSNQADTLGIHPDDIAFLKMVKEYRVSSGDTRFVINNPNAFFLQQFFPEEQGYKLNIDLLELLKAAGFNAITVAIETTNPRFNGKMNWDEIEHEMVYELFKVLRKMGFTSDVYMMYGFPGQTRDEFNADLNFAEKLLPVVDLITWNSLSLLPGTPYYKEYVEKKGREDAYRKIIRNGYSAYFTRDEFNLSEVSTKTFRDAIEPFGQSWV